MSDENQRDLPPGSNLAIAAGCTCPRIDNHYGNGVTVFGEKQFIYSADCPLHGRKEMVDVVEYD